MKKTIFILTLIFTFCFIDLISQVKSNLWYDGNARVTYNRDALEGILKEKDTTSSRSNGGGFTVLDLGLHFTPIDDIEISSEIRLKNDFGGIENKSVVELRSLSVKSCKFKIALVSEYLLKTN